MKINFGEAFDKFFGIDEIKKTNEVYKEVLEGWENRETREQRIAREEREVDEKRVLNMQRNQETLDRHHRIRAEEKRIAEIREELLHRNNNEEVGTHTPEEVIAKLEGSNSGKKVEENISEK